MRHKLAGRHLTRTTEHRHAMLRNMAQSLFEHGQIETTLPKAKELRPFVERLITLAKRNTLTHRQRLESLLGDRAIIEAEHREKYDDMSDAQRMRVLRTRSGRRHRTGQVPAPYNKSKIPFVARSVIDRLLNDVAPRYEGRPGGYTRIIRLARWRIGDNSDLAILQLLGEEKEPSGAARRVEGRRSQKTARRTQTLEGRKRSRKAAKGQSEARSKASDQAADSDKGAAGTEKSES